MRKSQIKVRVFRMVLGAIIAATIQANANADETCLPKQEYGQAVQALIIDGDTQSDSQVLQMAESLRSAKCAEADDLLEALQFNAIRRAQQKIAAAK